MLSVRPVLLFSSRQLKRSRQIIHCCTFGISRSNLPIRGHARCASTHAREQSDSIQTENEGSKSNSEHRHRRVTSIPNDGLTLQDFVHNKTVVAASAADAHLSKQSSSQHQVSFHIKTYGCQMNVNDSDIVRSILLQSGLNETLVEEDADVLLTNTCAIREGAEQKVWQRLRDVKARYKQSWNPNSKRSRPRHKNKKERLVGVLGCMAERLKEDLLQDGLADLVVGPDAYRDLPSMIQKLNLKSNKIKKNEHEQTTPLDDMQHDMQQYAVNVQLSSDETYSDITPVRDSEFDDSIWSFVSIQRGCSNRCSFCIVPFTSGVERSRPLESIVDEVKRLVDEKNIKEVTLLGQNVNSYHDTSESALRASFLDESSSATTTELSANPDNAIRPVVITTSYSLSNEGFKSRQRKHITDDGYFFADLLHAVSEISPELRVRFTSPHPKDYPSDLLTLMAERPNICNHVHMPAQSGSSSMLKRMKRGYTREAYLELIDSVKAIIPDVAITSDFIAGFCGETEEEHLDTVSLLREVMYDQAFMFAYSMRGKTHAHRTMEDDVPGDVKKRRLQEIIDTFRECVQEKNESKEVGRLRLVLVEGESKRSKPGARTWTGRTDQNKRVTFPVSEEVLCTTQEFLDPLFRSSLNSSADVLSFPNTPDFPTVSLQPGDYAVVEVTEAKGPALRGNLLWRSSIVQHAEIGLYDTSPNVLEMEARLRMLF